MRFTRTWGRVGVVLLGLTAIGAAAQDLPRYRCERLAGADLNDQNAFSTAINLHGEVAGMGYFARRANVLTAARWKSDGRVEYLFRNPRHHSAAYGINDAGDVSGYVMLSDGAEHPAVLVNGVSKLLPTLPTDGRGGGNAAAINNLGQVVGYSHVGNAIQLRATMWDQGRMVDLGALNDQLNSAAVAVNDHGVVVGSSDRRSGSHAVRWVDGTIHDLGTLPGGSQSKASGISLDGLVVGASNSAEHRYDLHATAWRHGEVIDLGTLPGHSVSQAFAVSPDGSVIVGESRPEDGDTAGAVAWFGVGGDPVVLDDLLVDGGCRDEKGSPRSLSTATGVNAHGDIAATSINYGPHGGLQLSVFRLKRL
jgi:probable HAF family extracellular repeat protein